MKIDFFARQRHYIDHLAPIWKALPLEFRGTFVISQEIRAYTESLIGPDRIGIYNGVFVPGTNPVLTAAYGDMSRVARNKSRKIITIEHGTGHGFGTAAYPNGKGGRRDLVDLFLMPNQYTADKSRSVRATPCEVIGTPKMDGYFPNVFPAVLSPNPLIAIAFHWGDRNADPPESGNALEHYKDILPALAARYRVIGHGHPLSMDTFRPIFHQAGIEVVEDFREVLARADLLINDLSSVLYEFLVTGKPVIVLNAPWFRRDVHFGIRFWDYSDVGINVEGPEELFPAIDWTLAEYENICLKERIRAIIELYPYLGHAAHRAADVLVSYLQEMEKNVSRESN